MKFPFKTKPYRGAPPLLIQGVLERVLITCK